jgi:threonine/homoserine/homoserine lactone efflux protein
MTLLLLLNFALGTLVSFIGTLPLGVLNVTIVRLTLDVGKKAAIQFAVTCAIVEIIYAVAAVELTAAIMRIPALEAITQFISLAALVGIGIYYLRKKALDINAVKPVVSPIYQGIVLSFLNVAAIPYWILYTAVLEKASYIHLSFFDQRALYILGISLGTFLGLLVFVIGSQSISPFLMRFQHRMDRYMGILFLLLAVLQGVDIVF